VKILSIISILLYVTPLLIGGESWCPKFFNSLRNPSFVILGLWLLACFKDNIRLQIKDLLFSTEDLLSEKKCRGIVIVISSFFTLFYLKIVYFNFITFNVSGGDFSAYANLIPNTMLGNFMYAEGADANHFGVHFSPIIYALWPFFEIFYTPLLPLFAHALLITSTVIPLYLIMKKKMVAPLQIVAIVFCFFNYTYLAQVLKFNFHIEVFFIPLFMWMFYFFETKKRVLFFVSVILLNLIKEDAALYIVSTCLGLFVLDKKFWKTLAFSSISTVVYFFINLKIIMPYFQKGVATKLLGNKYGQTLNEIVPNMLKSFHLVVLDYFKSGWLKTLLVFLFSPLSSLFFIVATFAFAIVHSSSGNEQMEKLSIYYSAPLISHVFFTLVLILKKNVSFSPKIKVSFFVLCFLMVNFVGGSYLKIPKYQGQDVGFSEVLKLVDFSRGDVCVQNSIFPQMGFSLNLKLASEGCLERENAFLVFNSRLNPYPFSKFEVVNFVKRYGKLSRFEVREFDTFSVIFLRD